MKKNTTAPKNSRQSNNQLNNNSVNAQQARILAKLEEVGSRGLTTIQIRDELNCLHPCGRVMELRVRGYVISTQWTTTDDYRGRKHRVARYVLIKHKAVAA